MLLAAFLGLKALADASAAAAADEGGERVKREEELAVEEEEEAEAEGEPTEAPPAKSVETDSSSGIDDRR